MFESKTFEQLELEAGIAYRKDTQSSLSEWYDNVRTKPLHCFSAGELSKALRQDLYCKEIMPFVIKMLERNILAGELYDGELVSALGYLSDSFWQENEDYRNRIKSLIQTHADRIRIAIPTEWKRLNATISSGL